MPKKKTLYIAFEGGEGGGKSTQAELLIEVMNGKVVHTREPGGTYTGEMLRDILIHDRKTILDPMTEALLMAASRAQLLTELIIPALESGSHVITERTFITSIIYQGISRDLGIKMILDLNLSINAVVNNLPDIIIVFGNSDKEDHKSRTKDKKDKIETESIEFHNKVAESYNNLENILKMDIRTSNIKVVRIEQYKNGRVKTPHEFHRDICIAIKNFCQENEYVCPI